MNSSTQQCCNSQVEESGDTDHGRDGNRKKLNLFRGHWKPAEDVKLRELVAQHGPQNWNFMAEQFQGRSGKSCRLRWYNQINPRINKSAFTDEEEEMLLEAQRLNGNKWSLIARLFAGRTDNAVKNHWHVIMARNKRECTTSKKRKTPITFLESNSRKNIRCGGESRSTTEEHKIACADLSLRINNLLEQTLPFKIPMEEKLDDVRGIFQGGLGYSERCLHGSTHIVLIKGTDQLDDALAAQSLANQRLNASLHDTKHNWHIPFIDFLGVGAL